MFAILRTGGKQYRVAPGDKIVVERLDGNAGDKITLGDILLAGEGSDLKSVDGIKVQAEIIAQAKGEKVTVFKKRRRHNYRRKKGHRQLHTILQITQIGDQKMEKKPAPSKAEGAAPKAETKAEASKVEAKAEASKAEAPSKAEPKAAKPAAKPAAKKAETKTEAKADKKASTENAAPAKAAAKKPAAKAPAKKK